MLVTLQLWAPAHWTDNAATGTKWTYIEGKDAGEIAINRKHVRYVMPNMYEKLEKVNKPLTTYNNIDTWNYVTPARCCQVFMSGDEANGEYFTVKGDLETVTKIINGEYLNPDGN